MARIDNLEFLSDVIPKTTTYKQFKAKKAREEAAAAAAGPAAPGQTTLQNGFGSAVSTDDPEAPGVHHGLCDMESNGVPSTPKRPLPVNGSPIADRTLHPSAHGHPSHGMHDDIEMMDEALP